MKSRTLTCITAITLFATLAIPPQLTAQHIRYTVTDLGTLGGTFGEAVGINNKGSMAGNAAIPGDGAIHATLWRHGVITDLGTLGGPNSAAPEAEPQPNAKGVVAGGSDTTTPDPNGVDFCIFGSYLICLPFTYEKGTLTPLPTLGGNNGTAFQVSNQGRVIGTAENATPDPSCPTVQLEVEPVIWERGAIQQLPTVSGDLDGIAFATNDRGQVVGFTGNCNSGVPFTSFHAVLWERHAQRWTATDLGTLGGTILNQAFGINDRGQVVGQSAVPGSANCTPPFPPQDCPFHAFLWQNGVMTDVGVLPGDIQGWAETINNNGQAVGTSFDANGNPHPFIWQDGVMTNLNTLIPPDSPWLLLEALGNNNRGQIVGYGLRTDIGEVHPYVATPCDKEHEGCQDRAEGTTAASQDQRVVLPENVRKMLEQRPGRRHHIPGLWTPKD